MTFAEQCIQIHKRNDLFKAVGSQDLKDFVVEVLEVPGIKARDTKRKMIEIAYEHLTPDSIGFFSEKLPGFGLTISAMIELFDTTKYMCRKLIKGGLVKKVGQFYSNGNHIIHVYSIPDIIAVHEKGVIVKKTYNVEPTDENLASAIYLVDKSANVSKETRDAAYRNNNNSVYWSADTREYNLSKLKASAIKTLVKDGRMTYEGIYEKLSVTGSVYFDCYRMCDFTFYLPHYGNVDKDKIIDLIFDEISVEKTRKVNINFFEAKYLLKQLVA